MGNCWLIVCTSQARFQTFARASLSNVVIFCFHLWVLDCCPRCHHGHCKSHLIYFLNLIQHTFAQEEMNIQQQQPWNVVFLSRQSAGCCQTEWMHLVLLKTETVLFSAQAVRPSSSFLPSDSLPLIQVSRGRPLKRPSIVLTPPFLSSLCTTPVSMDRPAFESWP